MNTEDIERDYECTNWNYQKVGKILMHLDCVLDCSICKNYQEVKQENLNINIKEHGL